jgi:hypothetical protein
MTVRGGKRIAVAASAWFERSITGIANASPEQLIRAAATERAVLVEHECVGATDWLDGLGTGDREAIAARDLGEAG